MARSIIGGLVKRGHPAQAITASNPGADKRNALADDFGIQTTDDNKAAFLKADVVVLAVKPQVMAKVCQTLAEGGPSAALVISVAAGISCTQLQQWFGAQTTVVRCMPNTPSLIQCGASGLYAPSNVSAHQRALAEQIMSAVGIAKWVEEEHLIDAVTAVSGSGPAYFFYFLEAMVAAAEKQGLDKQLASELAIQTAAGAAQLARESDMSLAELRRQVTSPGGTTEQAIRVFEERDISTIVDEAMVACARRSAELAQTFDS